MKIDWWTLGFQTVNVLILIWLLQRFFWRPVAAMIELRRSTAQQILADAKTKAAQATASLADIAATRAGFTREREAILTAAHAEAAQARSASDADATKAADALRAVAVADIEKQRTELETAWTVRAGELSIEIATRLAGRLQGPAVRAAFLDWLLSEIHTLPDPARQAMAANGTALDAFSATVLDSAEQARAGTMIADAFGAHPHIVFKVDPALIAGLELHGPHFTVGNSWRADLAKILTDITHDARH